MDTIAAAEHVIIYTGIGRGDTNVVTPLLLLVKIAKILIARYKSIIAMTAH